MSEKLLIYELVIGILMALGVIAIFVWTLLSGHLRDTEDIKYKVYEREIRDERTER